MDEALVAGGMIDFKPASSLLTGMTNMQIIVIPLTLSVMKHLPAGGGDYLKGVLPEVDSSLAKTIAMAVAGLCFGINLSIETDYRLLSLLCPVFTPAEDSTGYTPIDSMKQANQILSELAGETLFSQLRYQQTMALIIT